MINSSWMNEDNKTIAHNINIYLHIARADLKKVFKSTTPSNWLDTCQTHQVVKNTHYLLLLSSLIRAEEKQLPLGDDTTDQVVTNRWGPQPASQFKNSYNNFLFVRPIYNLGPLSFDRHPPSSRHPNCYVYFMLGVKQFMKFRGVRDQENGIDENNSKSKAVFRKQ